MVLDGLQLQVGLAPLSLALDDLPVLLRLDLFPLVQFVLA